MAPGKQRPTDFRGYGTAGLLCVLVVVSAPPLLLIAGCNGCRRNTGSSASPAPAGPGKVETDEPWQDDLLDYAVRNLNRLEEFHAGEVLEQILIRTNEAAPSRGSPASEKLDPLMATCPEPEMLRQIINRLNQWIRAQEPPPDWKPDPLIATLPEPLKALPYMQKLEKLEFVRYDGFALREVVWLRDVSDWARGDRLDDVELAKKLFDWTVRNIQLEADTARWIPLMPWETLLFGRGTAMERAWVFILLARQQNLDAVLLALAESASQTPPAEPDDSAEETLRPWAVAIESEGELYLFDPVLGLPIPGPDGVKLDGTGQLDIQPATLAQVAGNDTLLGQLDITSDHPYPVKSADTKRIVALLEASPSYLAARMKLVQSRLDPERKMVLTAGPTSQANRVKKHLKAISDVPDARLCRLWRHPFETFRRRLELNPQRVRQRLVALRPFFADPAAPLRKGRMLYLKGRLSGPEGAIKYLQQARIADQRLDQDEKKLAALFSEVIRKTNQDLPDEAIQRVAAQRARYEATFPRRAKQDAGYWLGLIAFERENYPSAVYYFEKQAPTISPGPWSHGASYNLARTFEASGEHENAIDPYLSDTTSLGYDGNLLRARWLKALHSGAPDQQPAAEGPEPPVAVPEPAIEEPRPAKPDWPPSR